MSDAVAVNAQAAPLVSAAKPAVPAHFQSFLAFDFGLKRTGVAYGSRMLREAQPQSTVNAEGDARWVLITKRIAEWQPDALVVGVPYHPDGVAHECPTSLDNIQGSKPSSCMARV